MRGPRIQRRWDLGLSSQTTVEGGVVFNGEQTLVLESDATEV